MATAKLISEKGEYVLSPLRKQDWDSLLTYIQYKDYYKLQRQSKDIPELQGVLDETLRECAKRKVSLATIGRYMQDADFDVIDHMVWLSLRQYHKGITEQEVSELVTFDNLKGTLDQLLTISGVPREEENPPQATVETVAP